jgi:hypothetical protein
MKSCRETQKLVISPGPFDYGHCKDIYGQQSFGVISAGDLRSLALVAAKVPVGIRIGITIVSRVLHLQRLENVVLPKLICKTDRESCQADTPIGRTRNYCNSTSLPDEM